MERATKEKLLQYTITMVCTILGFAGGLVVTEYSINRTKEHIVSRNLIIFKQEAAFIYKISSRAIEEIKPLLEHTSDTSLAIEPFREPINKEIFNAGLNDVSILGEDIIIAFIDLHHAILLQNSSYHFTKENFNKRRVMIEGKQVSPYYNYYQSMLGVKEAAKNLILKISPDTIPLLDKELKEQHKKH